MNSHHRAAIITIATASTLDLLFGWIFAAAQHLGVPEGLWFAVVTATTVGYGDIVPHGWLPHLVAVAMMLTIIPLASATFSLLTSGLTSSHVAASERRVKAHIEARLRHHLDGDAHDPQG